jgi:hypothetical protein
MKQPARALGKTLFRLAAILLCGIVAGFLLLVAAYALPLSPIDEHVRLSVPAMDGSWATGEIAYEQLGKGYQTTQLDNSTDAVMLLAAACESDRPLLQRVVDVSTLNSGISGYAGLLEYGRNGQANMTVSPSARYWLGFLIFLKPLLLVFSYMDIRMLLIVTEQLMLAAVIAGFCRRSLARFVPAFALALVCVTPAIVGFSLQFSKVFLLFMGAKLVLLYAPRVTHTRASAAAFFLIVGMATSYFDYLTYPVATFGMPFVLYLLLTPAPSRRDTLLGGLVCLTAWLAGYFGMWAGKWAVAALLGDDPSFFTGLLAKIAERNGYAAGGASLGLLDVLGAVFGVFAKKAYLLLAAAVAAVCAIVFLRARHAGLARPGKRPAGLAEALVITALLPFVWYALTANHTYNHAVFTSRALVVTVFAAGVLLTPPRSRVPSAAGR